MPPSIDYKQQPTETPDTSILALLPLFSYISSVGFVSLLVAWLAIVFPWGGGSVAGGFTVLFYFTVTASLYALMRGYSEIFKRGLGGWDIFMWGVAIIVSIILSIDIVIFGTSIIHAPLVFPGSATLSSSIVLIAAVIFQALYFLVESIVVALSNHSREHFMEDWYLAIYLFILSVNSIAVLSGLLVLGYYHLIW